jgi:hypothetical protein
MRNLMASISVFFISFLVGCSSDKKDSSYLIAEDTLVLVLADLHELEAGIALGYVNQKDSSNLPERYTSGIFLRNAVSKERFDSTFNYYLSHPPELEKIYSEVINLISEKQAKVE